MGHDGAGRAAGFTGSMVETVRRSALKHPRRMVDMTLEVWEGVVLPALTEELTGGDITAERERIREELRRGCRGIVHGATREPCKLNKGHIGGCSPFEGFVTVSIDRVMEILNG